VQIYIHIHMDTDIPDHHETQMTDLTCNALRSPEGQSPQPSLHRHDEPILILGHLMYNIINEYHQILASEVVSITSVRYMHQGPLMYGALVSPLIPKHAKSCSDSISALLHLLDLL
jgi:hypothetical protein